MFCFHRMNTIAPAGLAILVATISLCHPANAAVTASFAIVGPNPVTSNCPVTVAFTGSITYATGTQFAYSFNRFVNGVQQIVPGGTVTSGSGTIFVNDSIAISSPASGNTFDQIWVHNISGGQTDVYSNKAAFSVTCGSVPPPGTRNVVSEWPANIVAVADLASCTKRAPSMACGFILADSTASKSLVLGWDVATTILIGHQPGVTPGPADGFKVYRVDGGRDDLITKQPYENTRVAEIPKPSDGSYLGKCYAVTAYNSLAESSASAPFCIGVSLPVFHTVLRPVNTAVRLRFHQRVVGDLTTYPPTTCSDLCVGWYHDSANGTDVGGQYGAAWRGYLLFGRSTIRGLHVTRATLKLLNTGDSGCVDKVSRALGDWWDNTSWIDGDFGHESAGLSAESSSGAVFDVTLTVWLWANGQEPNNGFVITGRNEDTGANDTTHCISHFNPSAVLDIEQ